MEQVSPPQAIRERLLQHTDSNPPLTMLEREREMVRLCNQARGELTGVDCPACLNRGYFHRVDETGRRYVAECSCMEQRRSLERMKRSGLAELLDRYTFQNWQTPEPWQERARELAYRYAEERAGWFVMAGTVGAGKTHLCTALCSGCSRRSRRCGFCTSTICSRPARDRPPRRGMSTWPLSCSTAATTTPGF